ncbi:prolyl-tRNA synthetase associated domain-containing protein [Methanocorpusculum sp. MG]|uniref:Prolyl-tRNA synthetase associated domain-containing protein n=1 Tax=Methanocorpusculum petauri TaxID=3002863 RepID=A0ABT4IFG7_9EURY|nr:prolyl-tRNA synthetase associated domain-containing protein [Methanocorpusculum petauri]MCZ0860007.1 prolyl-tRNA synthetase associated domain-containing protein [Methanocorpusculum petauri]
MNPEDPVFALLNEKKIPYKLTRHPAACTYQDMENLGVPDLGEVCKNLFLRDAKGKRHFLVVLCGKKTADLKTLAEKIGSTSLSFASAERLTRYLNLARGEVTPFGILNDRDSAVEVIFDADLIEKPCIGVHPNINTITVWIAYADIRRIVEEHGNKVQEITLSTKPDFQKKYCCRK